MIFRSLHLSCISALVILTACAGALSACQDHQEEEPPLSPPAPLGESVRAFQTLQIERARQEAPTHSVPAGDFSAQNGGGNQGSSAAPAMHASPTSVY